MMAAAMYGATAVAVTVSWLVDPERTRRAVAIGLRSLQGLVPRILGMVTLVGLVVLGTLGAEWWAMGVAVGLSIMAMQLSRTGHPPAGADPLVVLVSQPGWGFIVTPVLLGAIVVAITAMLFHNLRAGVHYPKYWRG